MTDFDWKLSAACRGMDPRLFFVSKGESISFEAREACANCAVRSPCLNYALHFEDMGFWAGTTPTEREDIRKARRIRLEGPTNRGTHGNRAKDFLSGHGTDAGYARHRRRHEAPCDACRYAHTRTVSSRGPRPH